jgi:hypothetical protein
MFSNEQYNSFLGREITMDKKRNSSGLLANAPAIAFISFVGIVYIIGMFTNKPWYDELYTYYSFIERGPVYAAIHWPVPNNHVGYSVVSALLNFLGNPYVSLRGISVLAGIANLMLIYRLCLNFMDEYFSMAAMALYSGAFLVLRLAIQGRGYTLATTCLLLAASAVYRIAIGDCRTRNYVLFAFALCFGLYIVPSSLYWVIPVCVTGGLYLLLKKRFPDLIKLILSGVIAAVMTFFLYLVIWLAIGANLLCKDAGSAYYGLSQVNVILKVPFLSAKTGMDYMLATPYIQSIDRMECLKKMPEYFVSLFGEFYDKAGILLFVLAFVIMIGGVTITIRRMKRGGNAFLSLFISCGMIMVPIILMIQSVHPYLRVLSFYAVFMAIGAVYCLYTMVQALTDSNGIDYAVMILSMLISAICLLSPYYRSPLADRENDIAAVLAKMDDPQSIDQIFYLDDFQKYVIKFYYDAKPTEVYSLEEAMYVIAGPEFSDTSYGDPQWPVLYGYSSEMLEYVQEHMEPVAEAEGYTVYKRD